MSALVYFRGMKFLIAFSMLFFVSTFGRTQHVFKINDFKAAEQQLNVEGNAAFVEERLRLTPARTGQQGACWYKVEKIDITAGFETEFTFLISEASSVAGDGFAFIIQDQAPDVLGGTGDNIGYKGIPYVIAIEFDTKDDHEGSRNHINLSFYEEENGGRYRRFATVHEIPEITDGQPHFTKVNYQYGRLEVYLDSYIFPVLSVKMDVKAKIGADDGEAWLGFTSATSDAYANHDLLQWSLREVLPVPEVIETADIEVVDAQQMAVKGRKLRIRVWDHNRIDGDTISLKWGDQWILTNRRIEAEPHEVELTLHGFSQKLVLYANNVGMVPPNTATIAVFDGQSTQRVELNADLRRSEALVIRYEGADR
jgi:hypothetical protein